MTNLIKKIKTAAFITIASIIGFVAIISWQAASHPTVSVVPKAQAVFFGGGRFFDRDDFFFRRPFFPFFRFPFFGFPFFGFPNFPFFGGFNWWW